MASWHQSGAGAHFLHQCRAEQPLALHDHVIRACQDEDWEVRQSAVEWCHALIEHDWQYLFEFEADSVLHQAVSNVSCTVLLLTAPQTTDPIRLVRRSAYTATHALFKRLLHSPHNHTRAVALMQELRETDWARVMADQEPGAVYHEDDDVFPLEPDLTSLDANPLDCPF